MTTILMIKGDEAHRWEPGDPIYATYTTYPRRLAEVIKEQHHDHCGPCEDAASWPEPQRKHDLLRKMR